MSLKIEGPGPFQQLPQTTQAAPKSPTSQPHRITQGPPKMESADVSTMQQKLNTIFKQEQPSKETTELKADLEHACQLIHDAETDSETKLVDVWSAIDSLNDIKIAHPDRPKLQSFIQSLLYRSLKIIERLEKEFDTDLSASKDVLPKFSLTDRIGFAIKGRLEYLGNQFRMLAKRLLSFKASALNQLSKLLNATAAKTQNAALQAQGTPPEEIFNRKVENTPEKVKAKFNMAVRLASEISTQTPTLKDKEQLLQWCTFDEQFSHEIDTYLTIPKDQILRREATLQVLQAKLKANPAPQDSPYSVNIDGMGIQQKKKLEALGQAITKDKEATIQKIDKLLGELIDIWPTGKGALDPPTDEMQAHLKERLLLSPTMLHDLEAILNKHRNKNGTVDVKVNPNARNAPADWMTVRNMFETDYQVLLINLLELPEKLRKSPEALALMSLPELRDIKSLKPDQLQQLSKWIAMACKDKSLDGDKRKNLVSLYRSAGEQLNTIANQMVKAHKGMQVTINLIEQRLNGLSLPAAVKLALLDKAAHDRGFINNLTQALANPSPSENQKTIDWLLGACASALYQEKLLTPASTNLATIEGIRDRLLQNEQKFALEFKEARPSVQKQFNEDLGKVAEWTTPLQRTAYLKWLKIRDSYKPLERGAIIKNHLLYNQELKALRDAELQSDSPFHPLFTKAKQDILSEIKRTIEADQILKASIDNGSLFKNVTFRNPQQLVELSTRCLCSPSLLLELEELVNRNPDYLSDQIQTMIETDYGLPLLPAMSIAFQIPDKITSINFILLDNLLTDCQNLSSLSSFQVNQLHLFLTGCGKAVTLMNEPSKMQQLTTLGEVRKKLDEAIERKVNEYLNANPDAKTIFSTIETKLSITIPPEVKLSKISAQSFTNSDLAYLTKRRIDVNQPFTMDNLVTIMNLLDECESALLSRVRDPQSGDATKTGLEKLQICRQSTKTTMESVLSSSLEQIKPEIRNTYERAIALIGTKIDIPALWKYALLDFLKMESSDPYEPRQPKVSMYTKMDSFLDKAEAFQQESRQLLSKNSAPLLEDAAALTQDLYMLFRSDYISSLPLTDFRDLLQFQTGASINTQYITDSLPLGAYTREEVMREMPNWRANRDGSRIEETLYLAKQGFLGHLSAKEKALAKEGFIEMSGGYYIKQEWSGQTSTKPHLHFRVATLNRDGNPPFLEQTVDLDIDMSQLKHFSLTQKVRGDVLHYIESFENTARRSDNPNKEGFDLRDFSKEYRNVLINDPAFWTWIDSQPRADEPQRAEQLQLALNKLKELYLLADNFKKSMEPPFIKAMMDLGS